MELNRLCMYIDDYKSCKKKEKKLYHDNLSCTK